MENKIKKLRDAFSNLETILDKEYCLLRINVEPDLQCFCVQHLTKRLEYDTGTWIIYSCQSIPGIKNKNWKPDLACYYLANETEVTEFIQGKKSIHTFLVGVAEIKWATDNVTYDLDKLTDIQLQIKEERRVSGDSDLLAWMIFGNHFNADIHDINFKHNLEREIEICDWERKYPDYRGKTILKVGIPKDTDSTQLACRRKDLNDYYWIRDKNNK